jgi:hypothetical protein
MAAVAGAIVAGLAPAHLRGGYLGLFGASWSASALLAPLGGIQLLGRGAAALWLTCGAVANDPGWLIHDWLTRQVAVHDRISHLTALARDPQLQFNVGPVTVELSLMTHHEGARRECGFGWWKRARPRASLASRRRR